MAKARISSTISSCWADSSWLSGVSFPWRECLARGALRWPRCWLDGEVVVFSFLARMALDNCALVINLGRSGVVKVHFLRSEMRVAVA